MENGKWRMEIENGKRYIINHSCSILKWNLQY
jgi:hypothetical protein